MHRQSGQVESEDDDDSGRNDEGDALMIQCRDDSQVKRFARATRRDIDMPEYETGPHIVGQQLVKSTIQVRPSDIEITRYREKERNGAAVLLLCQ